LKRVGLPRALIHFKFAKMWEIFFKKLGAEIVISPLTTKKIKDESVRLAPNEDCYSTKLYFGHTMDIKDKVDYLFIPRFGSENKSCVGCPKFIGLAEVLRSVFPELPPIIMPHYNVAKSRDGKLSFFLKAYKVGLIFTKNPFRIIKAFKLAMKEHKQYKKELIIDVDALQKWEQSVLTLNDPPIIKENERMLKIALVGHSYVINDPFASLDIRKILQNHGVDVITSEQMPRNLIESQLEKLNFPLYFDYEKEILGTIMHFIESKTIDGIIHIMVFSCGPDSIAGEMATQFSKRDPTIPLLQLVFDELTAEAGLRTRIEAFIDMLRRGAQEKPIYITTKVHV
jgi:predicted nucleotide-binding protein (sugar kinase/HSP70/actin superfamily)